MTLYLKCDSLFLAKKGFKISTVGTLLWGRTGCSKIVCFDDMIKAKLHLEKVLHGGSEWKWQWSCNCTGDWLGKSSHSECNYFMRDARKSPRYAKRLLVAYLSFCSSCSFSLPSMKVVDGADSGQNNEEQKWGRNALMLFIGDLYPFLLFFVTSVILSLGYSVSHLSAWKGLT